MLEPDRDPPSHAGELERHVVQGYRAVLRDHVHAADEEASLQVGRHRAWLDHDQLILPEGLVEHHRPAGIAWNRRERRLENLGVTVNHRALDGVTFVEDSLRAAVDVSTVCRTSRREEATVITPPASRLKLSPISPV